MTTTFEHKELTPVREAHRIRPLGRRTSDARPRWFRGTAAFLVMALGLLLVSVTLSANLFKVGPAFENLTDDFRPVMTTPSLQTDRQDIANMAAVGTEFQTKLGPALARQLGVTPAQFTTSLQQQFPAVAAGITALPQITPTFTGLVNTLDQQQGLFRSADSIPTTNLPATTVPWGLLAVGLLLIPLGIGIWFVPRVGAVTAVALGVLMIVFPLMLSLPSKASNADQLNVNLKPVYTQQLINQADGALTTLSAMGAEMQAKMLPAMAQQLNMQPTALQAFLVQNFPATATALKEMPAALGRFQHLTATFKGNLNNYNTMKPVELVPIVWTLIGAGIAVTLVGGALLTMPGVRVRMNS